MCTHTKYISKMEKKKRKEGKESPLQEVLTLTQHAAGLELEQEVV